MKIHPFLMLLAAATMAAPVLSAATLTHTEDGSATWTRSSIISLNVTSTTGLVITDISHVTRGDDVLRDFFLYYRAGAFDESINIGTTGEPSFQPAHRVESAWTQISLQTNVLNSSNTMTSFTLNMADASDGTLPLDKGFYSFMLHSARSGTEGSQNGMRTVNSEGATGTVLDADSNLELIAQVSKGGSAFGSSTPNERVPADISITYIPEPSAALLAGIGMLVAFRRRRHA